MKLTPDDFEAWRHNPLTELILDRFLVAEMNTTKAMHDGEAWDGPLDPARHAAFRERHETLEWLRTLTFEEIEAWLSPDKESEA